MKNYVLLLFIGCVFFHLGCKNEKVKTNAKEAVDHIDPKKVKIINQTKEQMIGHWNVTSKLTVDNLISMNPIPYNIEAIWDFRTNDSIYSLGIFAYTYKIIDSKTLLIGADTVKYKRDVNEFHLKSKIMGKAYVEFFGKKIINDD